MAAFGAVVIGGSAGALEALNRILPALPPDYHLPVVVAVHLPADRPSNLWEVFSSTCRIRVREAEDKEHMEPAVVYFAPPNYHLLIEYEGTLALSIDPPEHFSRLSIDVLFESAGAAFGSSVVGIILSGANRDGAKGLASIHTAGGIVIVQTPDSALAGEMPLAALQACPDALTLNLEEISTFMCSLPHHSKMD